jgi:hypothetical protein
MKSIVLGLGLLLIPILSSAEDAIDEISDLALGLASEDLMLNLQYCLDTAEKEGTYAACEQAKTYYINLKYYMANRDLSKMDVGRRIRIEKRLAIVDSLQVK